MGEIFFFFREITETMKKLRTGYGPIRTEACVHLFSCRTSMSTSDLEHWSSLQNGPGGSSFACWCQIVLHRGPHSFCARARSPDALEFSRNEDVFEHHSQIYFTFSWLGGTGWKGWSLGSLGWVLNLLNQTYIHVSVSSSPHHCDPSVCILLANGSRSFTMSVGWLCALSEGAWPKLSAVADPPSLSPGNNSEDWAKDLKMEDFMLLCPDGSRKTVKEAEKCFLAHAPNHAVVSRKDMAACVSKTLLDQQVWTSQGLPFFLPGCVWIIWGSSVLSTALTPAFSFWKLELGGCHLWNWISQAQVCLYLQVTGD